jgi:PAS domain S-box-containing protein
MPDMVAIFDADRRIVRVNTATSDRLGIPAAELAGKKCYEYFHGTKYPVEGCPHDMLLNDQKEHSAVVYDAHLGGWFNVTVSPIYEKHHLIGVIHIARDISEQKRAAFLTQGTLNALSAHIAIVDPDGVILSVNRPWERFAEEHHLLREAAGVGINYLTVCDTDQGDYKNEAREFSAGLRAVLQGHSDFFEMEYPCETEDKQFWFCGRVTPFPGPSPRAAVVSHEDITARKKAELSVKESEERYRQLFQSMQSGFALHEIICDENGTPCDYRFLEVNSAFEKLTGLKAAALIGHTVKEILPATEAHWIEKYGQVALSGQPMQIEEYSTDLGHYYSVSAYSPRRGQFATVFSDVTNQKTAETAVRRALDVAEEANRAKTQFLANMSHELRTPLNAIIGLTELLADSRLDAEQYDYVQTIGASGEALLTIIADLLDLSRIEMGKLEVKNEPILVRDVIRNAVTLLAAFAEEKGVNLSTDMDESIPETINSDASRLQQVLINLLNNALKFTAEGSVRLTVRGRIMPSGSRRIEFSVKDSGEGMSDTVMRRIFEPFQQGDNSSTREHGGVGLGLAISKNLVNMMGGSIQVESREGEGSVFNFYITDQPAPEDRSMDGQVRDLWRGKTLCVWTDDPSDMRTAEYLLERCGSMPRYADTADAVYHNLIHEDPTDAVLCNLDMPGLAERLIDFRKIHPEVPWIALSHWNGPLDNTVKTCFSAFIDRPIRPNQLYGTLMQLAAD